MNKEPLFDYLKQQKAEMLAELLETAFDTMNTQQRRDTFSSVVKNLPPAKIVGKKLLAEIKQFHKDSFHALYYAPFDINWKNFRHIPEETEQWCEKMADLLKDSSKLSKQGKHTIACKCFALLYEVIFAMDEGEEIIFADEAGSWMIPVNESEIMADYLSSLAYITQESPEKFTKKAIPLIERDSYNSFSERVYTLARRVANKEQQKHLAAEVEAQNIRTH